ncbi:hypothetical protein EF910_00615 [Streptomyces sp. WAC07149]|nr:hypothetical protein EF910_00615 [Streptomyces sp. WAC07149]
MAVQVRWSARESSWVCGVWCPWPRCRSGRACRPAARRARPPRRRRGRAGGRRRTAHCGLRTPRARQHRALPRRPGTDDAITELRVVTIRVAATFWAGARPRSSARPGRAGAFG